MAYDDLIEAMHYDFGPVDPPLYDGAEPFVMTYAFRSSRPDSLPTMESFTGWTAFDAAEKRAVREALDEIEGFANVRFVEAPGDPDPYLDLGIVDFTGKNGRGGLLWQFDGAGNLLDVDGFALFAWGKDLSERPDLVRHEIGHALGLKHPFEHGVVVPDEYDNNGYSVMSYTTDPEGRGVGETYEILDIMALQYLWGENDSAATGGRKLTLSAVEDGDVALLTGGSTPIVNVGSAALDAHIDLRDGAFSYVGDEIVAATGIGAEVKRAIGGRADDRIDGTGANERLIGRGGDDELVGRGGRDVLKGGGGDDSLDGGRGRDSLVGGGGNDRIDGGGGADRVRGGAGHDDIDGGRGRDRIDGGRGRDEIDGGGGRDVLLGRGGADTIRGGHGSDDIDGGRHRDVLIGGAGQDEIEGGGGRDTIRGGGGRDDISGGRGVDVLIGGGGADTFHFTRGDGRDTIRDLGRGDDTLVVAGHGSRRDVLDAASRDGGDVVIDLGRDRIVIEGADIGDLEDALIIG